MADSNIRADHEAWVSELRWRNKATAARHSKSKLFTDGMLQEAWEDEADGRAKA